MGDAHPLLAALSGARPGTLHDATDPTPVEAVATRIGE